MASAWDAERLRLVLRVVCRCASMCQHSCVSCCEEFDDDKASGKLDIALGKVPVTSNPKGLNASFCSPQSRVDPLNPKPSTQRTSS